MRLCRFLVPHWKQTRYVSSYSAIEHIYQIEMFQPVRYHTLVRTIATARIVLPTTIIRLAAGRNTLAESEQAMCFMAGANAVFTGEQMLTTPCEHLAFDLAIHE